MIPTYVKPRLQILSLCVCFILFLPGIEVHAETKTNQQRPTIGLVLSGGGARGAAHVGVINVLEDLRIPVDYITGTSMGAIIGGLYASGMSADELTEVIETVDWSVLLTDRPPRSQRSFRRKSDDNGFLVNFDLGIKNSNLVLPEGFVQGQNFEIALKRLVLPVIAIDQFDSLPIPFRAVATDIVSGEEVVLGNGDLATAMRASMSAPGIFKPVRIDGRKLVDGGIANNLPVQAAQDMGADILIVVDVGFPLIPEEELKSAVDITKQMLTILVNARAQDQIALLNSQDILISPDLGDIKSQDFHRLIDAMYIGRETTHDHQIRLEKLSVSQQDYIAYRRQLASKRQEPPILDTVVVKNESQLSPNVIAARLSDQRGKPLDIDQLETDISNVYGMDTFETVTYDVVETNNETTLVVQGTEKSWGPNYLRFGVNLEDNFDGDSNFNLAARLTRTEINKLGGELRGEIQIGQRPRVFAELYQPLDYASRWFLNPQIQYGRSSSTLFDGELQLARLRSDSFSLLLEGGRQIGNWGEFRVGIGGSQADSDLQIGIPDFDSESTDIVSLLAGFSYDTIDRIAVPRSGTSFSVGWTGARESLGSDTTVDVAEVFILKPQTQGNHTLLHWWDFGAVTKNSSSGATPFSTGGLFNLSGYAPDELSASRLGIGRLLYYYRLTDKPLPGLDTPIYFGASVEAAKLWSSGSQTEPSNTLFAGSIFAVFDSPVGPLYIAYGIGEQGRHSAYLFLGQTF